MYWLSSFKKQSPLCYVVVDRFLVYCLLWPSVVAYWAAIWAVLDYFLKDFMTTHTELLIWLYILAGIVVLVLLNSLQYDLTEKFLEPHGSVVNIIVKRVYTAVAGWGNLFLWKGVWWAQDHYAGMTWRSGLFSLVLGAALLVALRSSCNGIAVPLGTAFDEHEQFFIIPTRFQMKNDQRCLLFLDSLFSVAVVGSLVVFEWRGVWVLLDIFIYPDNKLVSAILTIVIGYTVTLMVDMSQKLACDISAYVEKQYSWWWKLIFEDVYLFTAKVMLLFGWRGIWVACELWIREDNYVDVRIWNALILLVVAYIIPTALLHANSFFILEVSIDGGMADGQGCKVKVTVLNHFIEFWDPEKRKAKKAKQLAKEKISMLESKSSNGSSGLSGASDEIILDTKAPLP